MILLLPFRPILGHHRPATNFPNFYSLSDHLKRPPLWSSRQSSCLQIQRSGFDSRRYQISWKVEGLERGPLSLVSTTEGILERKSSGSSLENQDYDRGDPPRWTRDTYQKKLALTSPTSGGRSIRIDRSQTSATEWLLLSYAWKKRENGKRE
jgi:hypothetical protein